MSRFRAALRLVIGLVPRPVLVLLLLASIGVGAWQGYRCGRFEYHYRAAGRALEREAFEEAGEHLAHCLRLEPDSARAHFRAARAARRSGQLDFAEEELTACADLGWPPAALRLERALLAFQKGEFDAGDERHLRQYLREDNPDRFVVLEALAQGYVRTYRLVSARECLDAWLAGQPDSVGARLRRAWVRERLDRLAEAEEDYRQVVSLRPEHRAAKLRQAQLLLQLKKPGQAHPLFEELCARFPEDPATQLGLARCRVLLGRSAEARQLLEQLAARCPEDAEVLLEKGKLDLAEGRGRQARAGLRKACGLAPQAHEPHFHLLLCLRRVGPKEEAARVQARLRDIEADLKRMSELTDALQARAHDPELRLRIAEIFLRRGEEAEGVLWLRSVVRLAPAHPQAHRLLAEAYERLGQPQLTQAHREAARQAGMR